ncbi:Uncharacterised protein [Bartonella vinsonii]|uniref:Uncharacterized protein n=1 Tax=Bartonella vinsonii TaxID=33047 RepID=A0A448V8K4_BARVI|nr:Uncharacterised protein [Bartonella vinsonii]
MFNTISKEKSTKKKAVPIYMTRLLNGDINMI